MLAFDEIEDMNLMLAHDPFTGTWIFNSKRSKLSTPPPQSWVQEISATDVELQVLEKITSQDGSRSSVAIRAHFDGGDYAVVGSVLVDTFAYERDGTKIIGTGKKRGAVSIRETVVASEGPVITLTYSIFAGVKEVASGIAIFEKA
jgi:hypothetical protein